VLVVYATLFKMMFHCFDSFQGLLSGDAFQLDSILPGLITNFFFLVGIFKNFFDVLLIHGVSLVDQTSLAKAPLL
jgi:hypothetical protein